MRNKEFGCWTPAAQSRVKTEPNAFGIPAAFYFLVLVNKELMVWSAARTLLILDVFTGKVLQLKINIQHDFEFIIRLFPGFEFGVLMMVSPPSPPPLCNVYYIVPDVFSLGLDIFSINVQYKKEQNQ